MTISSIEALTKAMNRIERRKKSNLCAGTRVKIKVNQIPAKNEALHALFKKAALLKKSYNEIHSSKYAIGDLERSVMRCPEYSRAVRICGEREAIDRMHEAIL